jgi:hypothetical protein
MPLKVSVSFVSSILLVQLFGDRTTEKTLFQMGSLLAMKHLLFWSLTIHREYWKLCYKLGEHNIPVIETTSASGHAHNWLKIDTKYTKRGSMGGTQSWNQQGIGMYNSLLKDVTRNRNSRESKDLVEETLKKQ